MEHPLPPNFRAPDAPGPPRRDPARAWRLCTALLYSAVLGVGAGTLVFGLGIGGYSPDPRLQIAGIGAVLAVLLAAPIAVALDPWRRREAVRSLTQRADRLVDELRTLADHAALSDDARRVLNRRTEKDLLCRAIEEDIAAADWDAALVLCTELADRFGYRAEAEEFRARIDIARADIQARRVADAIARLDGLIVQRRWDNAAREAARIQRLFPDSLRVDNLRLRVEQARTVYKADLERRFLDAARADAVDDAMILLKELDSYLSETEAEPFREVARGVIGKARENLGVQFKLAVRDRHWSIAAAVGRRIINDFPNTRMATEVRELLDGILAKANAETHA